MDLKTIKRTIEQVSEEKGIDPAKVLEAIESSIAAAYKKEYEKKGEIIKAKFDLKTGERIPAAAYEMNPLATQVTELLLA